MSDPVELSRIRAALDTGNPLPVSDGNYLYDRAAEYRWVPITESLPTEGQKVMVLAGGRYQYAAVRGRGRWLETNGVNDLGPSPVTHWMSRPNDPVL